MTMEPLSAEYGSWHPGLESEIPREYLPLSTMFRIENVSTSISKAYELSDYCSLPPTELVAFRAERLIIHELLIHVTTTISVPDGGDYEDLGRNFREIQLFSNGILPLIERNWQNVSIALDMQRLSASRARLQRASQSRDRLVNSDQAIGATAYSALTNSKTGPAFRRMIQRSATVR